MSARLSSSSSFLFLLCLSFFITTVTALTCTLATSGGDFSTLQDAISLCRAPGDPSVRINVAPGEYAAAYLQIPFDVLNISVVGVPNNASLVRLLGANWFVNSTYWYPALNFSWVTIDMAGSNSSLFVPPLANNNLTFYGCNFTSFAGDYIIEQESCTDNTTFMFTGSTFWNVKGGSFKLQGMHSIILKNNTLGFAGANVTQAFMSLKPNWVTTGEFIMVQNHQWTLWDCRQPRCRYAQNPNTYDVRCNSYDGGVTQTLECFDRQATAAQGRCPIGDFVQFDEITNRTYTITNDYLLFCRVWAPCACQQLWFRNTTSREILSFSIGDIIYKHPPAPISSGGQPPCDPENDVACQSGPTTFTRFPCVPVAGQTPVNITSDMQFLGPTFPSFGDPATTLTEALTPVDGVYQYFYVGVINATCNETCPELDQAVKRNPEVNPCEWMIDADNATWCDEGAAECCADYLFEQDLFDIIYETNCDLRQNFTEPAVVNGSITLVNGTNLKVKGPFYHCDFLLNCALVPPSYVNGTIVSPPGVTGCTQENCFLNQCRLNATDVYAVNSTCWNYLNLGSTDVVYVTNEVSQGALLSNATTDPTGALISGQLLNATLDDGRYVNGSLGDVVLLSGNGTLTGVYLANGTSNITVDIVNGVLYWLGVPLVNSTLLSGTFANATISSPLPDCANYSIPTSDPLCLFLRGSCQDYYLDDYPLPGYALYGTTPLLNTTIILSPVCSFDVDGCIFANRSSDTRCNCTTSGPTGFISMDVMLGGIVLPVTSHEACAPTTVNCTDGTMAIVTSCANANCTVFTDNSTLCTGAVTCTVQTCADVGCNFTGLCTFSNCTTYQLNDPPKTPKFIQPRLLNVAQMNCTTRTFIQCDCPPAYTDDYLIDYCLPFPNVTNCEPVQLTIPECVLTPGCEVPPELFNYTVNVNGYDLQCISPNNSLTCDCGKELVLQLYPPDNRSIGIHIANIPETLQNGGTFQYIDNSFCWHDTAIELQQANYGVVSSSSTHEPGWYTKEAVMQIMYRDDNEFHIGARVNWAENDRDTPYRRECVNGCFDEMPASVSLKDEDYNCYVDAMADSALPTYGVTLFSTVYEALTAIRNGACRQNRTVLIRYNENPYNEPQSTPFIEGGEDDPQSLVLVFDASVSGFLFVSTDNAKIIGHNFWITSNVQNLTFVGIHFHYAGDTGKPLFNVVRRSFWRVNNLRFLNCEFEGAGSKGAGLIDTNRVDYLDMRYSTLLHWNYFAVRVLDSNTTRFEYNTIIGATGRAVEFRYKASLMFNSNLFIDCRGGSDLRGVPIVFARGTFYSLQRVDCDPNDFWCNYLSQTFSSSFFSQRLAACTGNNTCNVTQNVLLNDVTAADQDDIFLMFSGGQIAIHNVTDNSATKVRYGMVFIFSDNVNIDTKAQVMLMNPLMRPSLYRAKSGVPKGADLRIAGYQATQLFGSFTFKIATQAYCNFPCSTDGYETMFRNLTFRCMTNNNWTPETMPYYGDFVPRYGYYQYHNLSHAALYCKDFQIFTEDGRDLAFVYVTTNNGSRYYRDNVTVAKDTYFIADTTNASCALPMYKPCVRGQGHTVMTFRMLADDMCWELESHSLGGNHWQSDPDGDLTPADVRLRRNDFYGRGVDLDGDITAVSMVMGAPLEFSQSLRLQKNGLPPPTQGYFEAVGCTCQDYFYFPDDPRVEPSSTSSLQYVQATAPSTTCFSVLYQNLVNTNTSVVFVNNTCTNVDGACANIHYPINMTITDNRAENVTCRARDNTAGFFFEGNADFRNGSDWAVRLGLGQALAVIDRNNVTQRKECTYPTTANKMNLVDVVGMYMRAFPPGSKFCFRNNSVKGTFRRDVRWTDMDQTLFATCLTYPNQLFYFDALRFLRAIAREGNCNESALYNPMNATLHQLEFAFKGTGLELYNEVLICDDCCIPRDPTICYVDLGNGYFIPENPWYEDHFLFNSTNECINRCNATNRVCQILGSTDVFGFWISQNLTVPYKIYTETIGTTVGPAINANQSNTLVIRGDAGMEIRGCGNWLDNPLGVRITVEGVTFRQLDSSDPACATWHFNGTQITDHITLRANVFNGASSQRPPFNGTLDKSFYFNENLLDNYTGPHGVYAIGRQCNVSSLFSASKNTFLDFPGASLEIIGFDSEVSIRNKFHNAGGAYPGGPLYVEALEPCSLSPGVFRLEWNEVYATPGQTCTTPYTTAYYIDPAEHVGVKSTWSVIENRADGESCIGLQVNNYTPFECDRQDPQYWIRLFYYPRLNTRVEGQHWDLFVGPIDGAFQNFIDADPYEVHQHLCHWCNDGCPRTTYDLLAQILFGIFVGLFLCYAFICFCCPNLCFCCPPPDYGTHEDEYLKMKVPNDPRYYPDAYGTNYAFASGFDRPVMRPTGGNPGAPRKGQSSVNGGPLLPIPHDSFSG